VAQCAELAARQQRPQVDVQRVCSLVEHDRERQIGRRRREPHQLVDLRGVHTGRLLDERVHAALQRGDAHLGVEVVGDGGDDRVDGTTVEHRQVVVEERHAVPFGDRRLAGVDVADRAEAQVGDPAVADQLGVHAALGAEADDPEPDGA
jgi:hypothetical protein